MGIELAQQHVKTFSLVIYCAIIVLGTVGNGLVIYVTGCKMKKTVNSIWFLNLALADFLFTAFLVFTAISLSQQHHWPFGQLMCKLNNFVSLVNMFASVFFLTAISLDRCVSIWVVVWAQNKRTVFKAQVISAVIWLAAGICSSPYVYFRSVMDHNNKTYCSYSSTLRERWSLNIFRSLTGFLIPFLAILFSSVAIPIRSRHLQRARKRRFHRILFSITFAFFFCWLPFHVFSFMELKVNDYPNLSNIVRIGGPLSVSLAFMNSCLNPILYVFMCDEFQKKLKKSLCFVLESALAEDHLSFVSSLSSHFSRISRKSDSAPPEDKHKDTLNADAIRNKIRFCEYITAYNTTIDRSSGPEVASKHIHTFCLVIYCVITVVGTVGNGLVIYVTGFKMKKTVNSVWFLNLALADFLFTAFLVFSTVSLYQGLHWPFGNFMCKLNNFVSLINMFASVFFLMAINLDRCLSIWVVAWAQNERTLLKAQIMSGVIWLTAGICSTPHTFFRTVMDKDNKTNCMYNSTMTKEQRWSLYIFRFVMGFLIPFLAIFLSYVAIGIRSKRLQNVRKHLSHRIIVFIVVAFFICWLPFHVVSFMELTISDDQDLRKIGEIGGPLTLSLAFMNSCLNPILYVFIRDDFQNQLHQSVCFVLENALAEDHLPAASSRFLSPQFSRADRKSESSVPV
ncbi:uncharacterized protein FYW61_005814 [Anableps anableps]